MSQDPQFGPVLMFGLGGVFVEVLKDVSLRVAPLSRADAEEMIKEIKGHKLLEPFQRELTCECIGTACFVGAFCHGQWDS